MNTYKPLPDAVQWSHGLLLSPQHLQQNDIYWHEHLRHRIASIAPHYWGVLKMSLDVSSLVKGTVSIARLECVMPDGLAAVYPGHPGAPPLDVDVGTLAQEDGRPVRVWLQVHARGSAAAKSDNPERRFDSLPGEPTPDENGEGDDEPVGRLRPCLRLVAADAARPGPVGACPLLEVVRDAEGRLRLGRYHPPMLRQKASAFLGQHGLQQRMTHLAQRIWIRIEELAGARGEDRPDDDAAPSPQLRAARHLAMALPHLEICVHAPDTHPAELYRVLASVIGHVACLGSHPMPLKMTPYRHEDCMPQFQQAFDYIDAKLALADTSYEMHRFVPLNVAGVGPVRFARALAQDTGDDIVIELQPAPNQRQSDLADWLLASHIVSNKHLRSAMLARLRGARPRPLDGAEAAQRGVRLQGQMFVIENADIHVDGGARKAFAPGEILTIHGPAGPTAPAAIILHRRKTGHAAPTPQPDAGIDDTDTDDAERDDADGHA